MDIQILNIAELLLFVFMICTCIRIYRQKKQKGKISLKTLIMFLINLIFYAMVTGTNYHRTHPGESKFQAGITYNNVRIFIYSIVFCLGLAIMKKMKKACVKVDYNMGDIMYGISNCNVVLRNRKCICEFFNSRLGRKVLWN